MLSIEDLKSQPTAQRIGRRIVAIRALRGITQTQLAKECGISNRTLSDIENGKTDFRISIIAKIEDVLGATLILVPNEDIV